MRIRKPSASRRTATNARTRSVSPLSGRSRSQVSNASRFALIHLISLI